MNIQDIKATLNGATTRMIKRCPWVFGPLYKKITKTQWYSKEQMELFQLERLQHLVKHAWETVPYYNRIMREHGIMPDDIQHIEDIKRFPVISKADLKKVGWEIVSKRYWPKFLKTAHTGGTTGLPVPIRRDMMSIAREHAFVRRQMDWAGVHVTDRCAYLEGRTVAPLGEKPQRYHYYDAAMRELTLSTFHLTHELVSHYVDIIKEYKIKALIAYPSAAYVLAKGCLDKGLSLKLHCVLTTSETLDEAKKKIISEAFNCPVFDFYGSAERVVYIHTCETGSYHVIPEYGYTELIPAESPNEDCCRVISTGFWNLAMPLIRYDMGDLVRPSSRKCSCGRAFPVVEKILGRDGNIIVTPEGIELGASAIECILAKILYTMYQMPVVTGRVIQTQSDLLTLEFVPAQGFEEEHGRRLQAVLREQMPHGMRSEIRRVEQLERTPRGKYLSFVMSEHH